MSSALRKEESNLYYLRQNVGSWHQESSVTTLIKRITEENGQSFEDRLAQVVLRERLFLPLDIRDMAELHLYAYGRNACPISRAEFGASYGSRIVRELLDGKPLPNMGRRGPEVLFFGALMLLLDESGAEYALAKEWWNGRVQRHCRLV